MTSLVDRTREQPGDLFLAAITQQTLVLACSTPLHGEAVDRGLAELMAGDEIVATTGLLAFARARHPGSRARDAARALLASAPDGLVRLYLGALPQVHHSDPEAVADDLQELWQSRNSVQVRCEVLDALRGLSLEPPPGFWSTCS